MKNIKKYVYHLLFIIFYKSLYGKNEDDNKNIKSYFKKSLLVFYIFFIKSRFFL